MIKSLKLYYASLFLIGILIILGLSSLMHGPKVKGLEASPSEFSAMRAFADLEDLVGNNLPHPSGSLENLRIRKAIEEKFKALGYNPEIQSALGCTLHYPGCTQVENIIVHHKGTGDGDVLMLTSHYDSVPASPAAADDGAGTVAILEVARILKTLPPQKNDIVFLITDGEEGGLRGAQAFTADHPLIKDIKLVINVEARGVSGPSSMFETSANNLNLIRAFARTNPYPVANSLSGEVYARLPNDTDYSIYKAEGILGLNFAFTGDVALYHSLYDDVDHLDKTSLQHHGENMLAAIHAFGNMDMSTLTSQTNATYIDVFGRFLLHWSSALNLPLALFVLVLLGAMAIKSHLRPRSMALGIVAIIAASIVLPALGWLLSFPLGKWPDLFYLDHPYPWPGRLSMIAAAIFTAWVVPRLLREWVSYNGLVWASGIMLTLGTIALSILLPGASYLLLLPAIGITFGMLIDLWRKHDRYIIAAHIGLLLAAYMAFYHFFVLEVVLHYKLAHIRVAPLLILVFSLMPIFACKEGPHPTRKVFGFSLAALTIGFAAFSAMLPGFNASHPRMQNLIYIQGHEDGKAIWVSETSGRQDMDFLKAAGFENPFKPQNLLGVTWGRIVAKNTPSLGFDAPSYAVISDSISEGVREIKLDIQSSHGGYGLGIGFDKANPPLTVSVNNQIAANYTDKGYRRPFMIRGGKKKPYNVTITTPANRPLELALIDVFSMTTEQMKGLAAFRSKTAAPLHSGDRAYIYTLLKFECEDHCNSPSQ